MLRQPTGTNHFQLRFHQFAFGIRGTVHAVSSIESLYVEGELDGNQSLRCDVRLTARGAEGQDARHEATTLSPNYLCRRLNGADDSVCDRSTVRSSRARWHVD